MIPNNKMKRSGDGYVWDPDAWRANAKERRTLEDGRGAIKETEYQKALALWHLRCNMEKTFGFNPWMKNVYDPTTVQWNEKGERIRPAAIRTLNHTPPKQKRSL